MRWIVVFVVLGACATVPAADVTRVAGPGFDGVIFSADYAHRTFFVDRRPLWTPTERTVAAFERRFASHTRYASYKRQYIGMFERGTDRRLMRVNLLCATIPWTARPIMYMSDGYGCDCAAWFDPVAKRVLDFGCADGGYPRDVSMPPSTAKPYKAEPDPPPVDPSAFN